MTTSPSRLSLYARQLRVHQWVKNVLLFVPLVMAHQGLHVQALTMAMLGFVAFCGAASFVYCINDLLDIEADRQHRTKKERPLASGRISITAGKTLAAISLVVALGTLYFLPPRFAALLGLYLLITTAYSIRIKAIVVADIIVLASLYTLRVLAGAVAAQVHVSQWLLLFCMFFFLSLACMKRFSELRMIKLGNGSDSKRRGYVTDDLELISQCGCSAGYLSVLILALYVSSKEVEVLYSWPQGIYLLCPLFLYWITRVWILAHRGEVHDDPIVFALTDRVSYGVGLGAAVILFGAL